MVENGEIKLLWDFGMVTDHMICHNCPGITVFSRKDHRILFIEIACPADVNTLIKDKIPRLSKGAIGYSQHVDIIPVAFGLSGVVSCCQVAYLKKLPSFTNQLFGYLQQAAILGTVLILQSMNIGYT